MINIPLFARFFGSEDQIEMRDLSGNGALVSIDYIYDAFKERFLADLKESGYKIVKIDE